MIRAAGVRNGNGQIQFSLKVPDAPQLRPRLSVVNAKPAPSFARQRNQSLWLPTRLRHRDFFVRMVLAGLGLREKAREAAQGSQCRVLC
jgi:hypothetical protein